MNKEAYWQFFTNKQFARPNGMTDKRLEKIKPFIMGDAHDAKFFWNDLARHGCDQYNDPTEYQKNIDKSTFEHCVGNFHGMLIMIMYKNGVVKTI